MANLNDPATYSRLDPAGMGDRISEMAHQLEEAGRAVAAFEDPGPEYRRAEMIAVLGLGGSAIGADLVRTLAEYTQARTPMVVCRDYRLPGFIGKNTLVIASSYSGSTEETLSATQEALDRGARVMAMTTGGKLAQIAGQRGFPVLSFKYAAQPRAALGFSFGLLLGALGKLGYLDAQGLDEAAGVARQIPSELGTAVPADLNFAKQLAQRLHGKLPIVYGAGILSEVARRWKGQFNENSKAWAYFEQLPELNHNAVVGYENPSTLGKGLHVLMLSSSTYHPRVAARVRITGEILRQRGVEHEVIEAHGGGPVAQMLHSIMTGDYTSYYLAMLYETDPSPVKIIDFLKGELAAIQ